VRSRCLALALLICALSSARTLEAQQRDRFLLSGMAGLASVTQKATLDTVESSGVVFGLEAGVRFWRAELRGRYVQGKIDADGETQSTDLVEGELLLGVWPVDHLALRFGPRARSYVTDAGTVRWVFWEARARFEANLVSDPRLQSYVEGWYVLSGSVNAAAPFGNGRGLEGGVGLLIPSTSVRVRLGYRVDQGTLEGGTRTEAVEEFILAVGIGR